jgi:hypothetical protein
MQKSAINNSGQAHLKWGIIIPLVVLVFVVCILIFINAPKIQPSTTRTPSPTPSASVMGSTKTTPSVNPDLPNNSNDTTSGAVPTNAALTVKVLSSNQSGGLIKSTAQTSDTGTCVFLYAPADGGRPVTREVASAGNLCSVSISQNEFTYLGTWKLTVTYYREGAKAEVSQDVSIN